jgi:hypothetical protein
MSLTLSPQIRLVALLGGVAALGLAVFTFTAGRSTGSGSEASAAPIKQLHPMRKAPAHPARAKQATHTRARHVPAKRAATPVHAAPKPQPKPHPKPLASPAHAAKTPVSAPGIPAILARALARHPVVVVALYDPEAELDGITLDEASAGAAASHVGFVPLNVLKQAQAGPLTSTLGVLPDPAVLVYRRPGQLVARFDGFADRDTVAQAAANAALAAR